MGQATFGGQSAACCKIPPIVTKGYEAKGKYETFNGMKTYVTGPSDAIKAILYVMDVFGFYEQSLQGADIIATSDDHNKYKVFMPDWFDGKPADISWYPPQTDEQGKHLNNFFSNQGAPPKAIGRIPDTIKDIEKQHSDIKTWGIIGFCWGGKVVTLSTQSSSKTPFTAAAVCHPAMVDPSDASSVAIPYMLLASKDENAEDVKKFEENLKTEKFLEIYPDQIHGWMAARADLGDEKVRKEYERGYKNVVEWFGKYVK